MFSVTLKKAAIYENLLWQPLLVIREKCVIYTGLNVTVYGSEQLHLGNMLVHYI